MTPGTQVTRETCVLRYALERHAGERPDAVFAVFDDGRTWSWARTLVEVAGTAAALQRLGVQRGDHVLMMLPNGEDAVRSLFAINYLGAVAVPVNPDYRGRLLEHVLDNSGAALAIVHPATLGQFEAVELAGLKRLVTAADLEGGAPAVAQRCQVLGPGALRADPAELEPLAEPIEPWHTQSIIYTSGTTGPSKGVLSSYLHAWSAAGPHGWDLLRDDDRHLVHMPVFHIGGAFICFMAVARGGSIAVVPGFRTDTFWETVTRREVTAVFLLGAMATFLLKQAPGAFDRAHKLRLVFIVPLRSLSGQFRERFGVDVWTLFNMTEISTPLRSGLNPVKPNVCGRPRPGVTVRLVDENDIEVAPGTPGELIVRTDLPWAMNHGYHGNAEATARAWRNGWFHTGDVFVVDEDGDFYFVDRRKDMIRRRGENISAQELEGEVIRHPAIREVAAVAVPSEHGEDDVLLAVSLQPGASLSPEALLDHLCGLVPHFMLPRYVRILEQLPLTPTAKVRKQALRDDGISATCWDREAAGYRVRSRRLD